MQLNRRQSLAACLAIAAPGPAFAQAAPVARTEYGRVRGARSGATLAFKGIHYGADTGGARRFMAPARPQAWRGVRDALQFGPACPQANLPNETQSEDCLVLNVWTPALSGRRPVMVYIHGGAYASGSGSGPLLDGTRLSAHGDVVVVSLNHRLGALGYLYLEPSYGDAVADSANAGQLDLIVALKWVRDNIASFGGDPGCVTVFGQSGGGAKIATLMAMPVAAGLFHRAATMSGQQVTVSGPQNAAARASLLLQSMGASGGLEALRAAPLELIFAAARTTDPILRFGGLYFGPVLDQRHIDRHPFFPDAAPQSLAIPLLLGNTHDETRGLERAPEIYTADWADITRRLEGAMRIDLRPDFVVREYRRLYPLLSPTDVFFAATTAARSWRGQIIEAEERARAGAPAYVYQLNWRAPRDGGRYGAPHTLDIPLVFGTLEASEWIGARTPEAEAMSAQMMDRFIRFARTGDPGWAPYTLPTRQTMILDTASGMQNDPRRAERELFAKVPYIQPGT